MQIFTFIKIKHNKTEECLYMTSSYEEFKKIFSAEWDSIIGEGYDIWLNAEGNDVPIKFSIKSVVVVVQKTKDIPNEIESFGMYKYDESEPPCGYGFNSVLEIYVE